MKRRTLLVAFVLAVPAAVALSFEGEPAVRYHGTGIVNRVDPNLGVINISHGPVPEVAWGPMTRDLRVKPRTLAQGLVPGMAIRFQLTAADRLTHVITAVEQVR